jgi:plastocyanin
MKARMFFGVLNALVLVALVGACGSNATPTAPPPAAASGNPTAASVSPTMSMPTVTVAATTSAVSAASVAPTASAAAAPAASPTQVAPAGTSVSASASATTGTPGVVEAKIVDFAFDPVTLTVPVGTKVTWRNTGVQHTVLSVDGLFSSKILDRGDTFSFTFDKAGTFKYVCGLHPDMKATIIVQ